MTRSEEQRGGSTRRIDRAAFATYFVGAVLPLLLLAVVIEQFALPALGEDAWGSWTVIGALMAVGLVSLSAFLFLRRLIRQAIVHMEEDNQRLGQILSASQGLTDAPHGHVVAEVASRCALQLARADAALVLLDSGSDKAMAVCETAGEDAEALYRSCETELDELIGGARASRSPAVLRAGGIPLGADDPWDREVCGAVALPLAGESGAVGALLVLSTDPRAEFTTEELDALATLAGLGSVALRSADLQDAQRNFFTHVTEILVMALDAHVDGRDGHGTSVARIANRIGRELAVDDSSLQRLHFAALLHDIGMLRIPHSQHGNFAQVRKHPLIGHRMLSQIRLWGDLAPIVLHHHEHFDGSGAPDGLAGSEIPLEARIIHLADAYDLRVRGADDTVENSLGDVMTELRREAGTRFDPEVLAALGGLVERGELPPID